MVEVPNCFIAEYIVRIFTLKVVFSEKNSLFSYAGYDVVAPSDMMDNRVSAIKQVLAQEGFGNKVNTS